MSTLDEAWQNQTLSVYPSMNVTSMLCASPESLEPGGPLIVKGEEAGQDVLVSVTSLEPSIYSSVLYSLMRDQTTSHTAIKSSCHHCDVCCDFWCDCC